MIDTKQNRNTLKKNIIFRLGIVYFFVVSFCIIILGRILYLQTVEKETWMQKANEISYKDITLEPNRGDIYAVDGRILASSVPFYEIRMDLNTPALTDDIFNAHVDSLGICLADMFEDKTAIQYAHDLKNARKNNNRYYLIHPRVNFSQLKKMKKFPIFRRGKYKGGLIYMQKNTRVKPHLALASRTIGYTTKDQNGNTVGIEGAYDHILRGREGIRLMQRLSGNVWMPINDDNEIEPQDGKDIVSTIDLNLQDVAHSALLKQLVKHDAQYGTAVLMEVKTGEIKAIVNLNKDTTGVYNEEFNFAVGELYEPGSTFKLASLIAVFEDGYVKEDDTINTGSGKIKYYNFTIKDSKLGGYGKITVKEAFEVSSNVGVSQIIFKSYKDNPRKFVDRLYSMGLNEKVGTEIIGEAKPYIKYPGDTLWSNISLAQMAIGYEVLLTPLQILTFYNAVANDGKMVKPKFVKAVKESGKIVERFDIEVLNTSICSKETVEKVQAMLEGVVERGTAINIRNKNYKIAGKTGTSQIGYWDKSKKIGYQASFAGYFPADNPKYSCIVVINSPSKNIYYGNLVAGPVFKEIADKVYVTSLNMHKGINIATQNLEVPFSKSGNKNDLTKIFKTLELPVKYANSVAKRSQWVTTTKRDSCVFFSERTINNNIMPKVVGMSAKDAIYLLENMGLKVIIQGRGVVTSQSITQGRKIRKGEKVIITLS